MSSTDSLILFNLHNFTSFTSLDVLAKTSSMLKISRALAVGLGWVLSCKLKGHWFDSWSGRVPGLQAPAGELAEGKWLMFLSMFLSLSFSFPPPLEIQWYLRTCQLQNSLNPVPTAFWWEEHVSALSACSGLVHRLELASHSAAPQETALQHWALVAGPGPS